MAAGPAGPSGPTAPAGSDATAQSHAELDTLRCDGRTPVQRFQVDQTEVPPCGGPPAGSGTLVKGAQTCVQCCLTPLSAVESHPEDLVISGVQHVNPV